MSKLILEKEIGCGLDSSDTGRELVECSCENGNEPIGSIYFHIYWPGGQFSDSQEKPLFMELVIRYDILAYRPIAKRWLCKQRTLPCNAATFHRATIERGYATRSQAMARARRKHASSKLERLYFLCGPCNFTVQRRSTHAFSII
jgi:hypothetical protein